MTGSWWTDDYIERCIAAGRPVPASRLRPYLARNAGIVRPDACPVCGSKSLLYLVDGLRYVCGACRGRALKESNRKPRGRPRKTQSPAPAPVVTSSEILARLDQCMNARPVPVLDTVIVRPGPLPSPNKVRESCALATFRTKIDWVGLLENI